MSFRSNSSSIGAQNGSAYGDTSYSTSPPTNGVSSRTPVQQRLSGPSTAGGNPYDRNTPTSRPIVTLRNYRSTEQYTHRDQSFDQDYINSQQNHVSPEHWTTTQTNNSYVQQYPNNRNSNQGVPNSVSGQLDLPAYTPATPRYADALTLDDEYQHTAATGQRPRTPPQQNHTYQNDRLNQANPPHSPTTERWQTTLYTDERLRLGLPRYPNEEERRRAYGNVADSHRGN
ncbi:hypothetical protein VTL71DRAFT_13380 [Oculimacula yallundae]|uniref:Uncharacterized protein n=1 Tax=Oculimacula yallundae TaxID=86028 RepID=A0ABR4CMI3_9HELO